MYNFKNMVRLFFCALLFGSQLSRLPAQTPASVYQNAIGDLRSGDSAEAIRVLQQALVTEPGDIKAHTLLGMAFDAAGRQADAKLELERRLQ